MPCVWEGNRSSGESQWPCVTDFSGLSTYGLTAYAREIEHPSCTSRGVRHTLPFDATRQNSFVGSHQVGLVGVNWL